MRAEQHGGAALGRDPADVAEDLPLAGRVEAERRLVEEDDERVVHERARDSEALPHAAAEARDERAAAVEETDLPEEAARGRVRAGAPLAVEARVEAQVLLRGLPLRVAGALREDADPPADLGRPRVIDAGDAEPAARRLEDRRQDTDGGRLAGAVRSEEAEHLARFDGERQVLDREPLPVPLFDALGLDGIAHGGLR